MQLMAYLVRNKLVIVKMNDSSLSDNQDKLLLQGKLQYQIT